MKLAVTHLTRMAPGYVCVAGVNVDNGQHIRPVLRGKRLEASLCRRRGGPIDMAFVIDLGVTRPVPRVPEVEDHEFMPDHARAVQAIEPKLFWDMLRYLAKTSLEEIFGPDLRPVGRGRALMPVGSGIASLGCLAPVGRPTLVNEQQQDGSETLRLRFSDVNGPFDLSVTDLRLYAGDHVTALRPVVQDVAGRLAKGTPCLLSVGLTRPYAPIRNEEPAHWLQVNNIHLSDDPCWRLSLDHPGRYRSPVVDDGDLDDLPF